MRASIRSSNLSGLAGAVAALWLGAGAAWAGDGQDLGSIQALLSNSQKTGICDMFFPKTTPCPIPNTITQAVLEVAALGNNLLEMIRAQNNIPPGTSVNAGNAAAVPPVNAFGENLPMPFPVNSTSNPPLFVAGNATTPPSGLLTTLTPLAFASQSSGTTAVPTQLYATTADTFLYAVGVSVSHNGFIGFGGLTDPDMVYFFYEDRSGTTNFTSGQTVAKFLLPLTVLNNDGTERAVPTTLNFIDTSAGDCSSSTVIGDFKGNGNSQTLLANTIGISCAVVLSPSPTSTTTHAIFEVAVPALITGAKPPPNTDPLYFYSLNNSGDTNPVNTGVFTVFEFDDPGTTPAKSGTLGSKGKSIGLAPSAGPLALPASGTPNFALCAVLPSSSGTLNPAVGAYYAMATSGEMLLSAPLPAAFTSGGTPPVCPQL